jgi:hypothetical protein
MSKEVCATSAGLFIRHTKMVLSINKRAYDKRTNNDESKGFKKLTIIPYAQYQISLVIHHITPIFVLDAIFKNIVN